MIACCLTFDDITISIFIAFHSGADIYWRGYTCWRVANTWLGLSIDRRTLAFAFCISSLPKHGFRHFPKIDLSFTTFLYESRRCE